MMQDPTFSLHPQLAADSRLLRSLDASDWLLMNDARFVWLAQVPRCDGAKLLVDLAPDMRAAVRQESDRVVRLLQGLFSPDQINVAQIGNVVSQLHIHHVCRFADDALWPKPIWGQTPAQPYTEAEYEARLALLRAQF